jgi:hypothetical protein
MLVGFDAQIKATRIDKIDQIVRTDMKELVDLDLQDHVYGYPPMGDDRHEMEGFRFWKTGYWKDALRGRPYHISALYVVDLKRFRQLATGVSCLQIFCLAKLIRRIDYEVNIMLFLPIPTPLPISTKIYLIQCKIKSQSSPWIKIGYGAKLGVPTNP